jgi:hypothetical protein
VSKKMARSYTVFLILSLSWLLFARGFDDRHFLGLIKNQIISPVYAESVVNNDLVKVTSDYMLLDLSPMDADGIEAFLLARGFTGKVAKLVATTGCFYKLVVRNNFDQGKLNIPEKRVVKINLADWLVDGGDGWQPIILKKDWENRWDELGVSEMARIAFHWSQFPTEQDFEPGDYNWGMMTMGLANKMSFKLDLRWWEGGVEKKRLISPLRCFTGNRE